MSSKSHHHLALDAPSSDGHSIPFEVFEASQAQLRDAAVALSKHKTSLASSLGEISNLKNMMAALEKNVESLKMQNEDLFQRLRESRSSEEHLLGQVTKLTETTEFLSQQLQMHAKTSAQRYTALLELKGASEAQLRLKLERVTDQLLSSQQPSTRVIPWSMTFKQHEHPAHVVRMVVAADAQRENRMLRLLMASGSDRGIADDREQSKSDVAAQHAENAGDLARLLIAANDTELLVDAQAEDHLLADMNQAANRTAAAGSDGLSFSSATGHSSAFSEDTNNWRNICRRLHQVLVERRSLLRTKADGPLEFLLRSRHEMAASIVQMREDTRRIGVVLNTMIERMEGGSVTARHAAMMTASKNDNNNNNNVNHSSNAMGAMSSSDQAEHVKQSAAMTQRMLEGSIESLQTVLGDVNNTVQRAIVICFSDADRVIHGLSTAAHNQQQQPQQSNTSLSSSQQWGRNHPRHDTLSNYLSSRGRQSGTSGSSTTAPTIISTGGGGGVSVAASSARNSTISRRTDKL